MIFWKIRYFLLLKCNFEKFCHKSAFFGFYKRVLYLINCIQLTYLVFRIHFFTNSNNSLLRNSSRRTQNCILLDSFWLKKHTKKPFIFYNIFVSSCIFPSILSRVFDSGPGKFTFESRLIIPKLYFIWFILVVKICIRMVFAHPKWKFSSEKGFFLCYSKIVFWWFIL